MAKKFGKFLLFTAAVSGAAAAAYYYLRKKDTDNATLEDEDYDDFSEDLDEDPESARNYVALKSEPAAENSSKADDQVTAEDSADKESVFTPLTEQVSQVAEKAEESVEEFFDEEKDPN